MYFRDLSLFLPKLAEYPLVYLTTERPFDGGVQDQQTEDAQQGVQQTDGVQQAFLSRKHFRKFCHEYVPVRKNGQVYAQRKRFKPSCEYTREEQLRFEHCCEAALPAAYGMNNELGQPSVYFMNKKGKLVSQLPNEFKLPSWWAQFK